MRITCTMKSSELEEAHVSLLTLKYHKFKYLGVSLVHGAMPAIKGDLDSIQNVRARRRGSCVSINRNERGHD